jgi:SAM-dependent methyltransferase
MFLRSWYVRSELKKLRKEYGRSLISIYDAGSGYGQYSYFMSKKLAPCDIYSVDVKEDWINDCKVFFDQRKINNVSFAIEDLTKINHKDKYDIIVCVDVMEHIQEDGIVFKNFFNALKTNGYILINSPSIYGGSDVHSDEEESFIGEHARVGYSKEDLEIKLHSLGFSTFKCKYTYGFWGDKAWRLGIKYPLIISELSELFLFFLPFYYLLTLPLILIMMKLDYVFDNKIGSGINFIAKKL